MDRDQLIEHLTFAQELGVTGMSRDPAWRQKGVGRGFPEPLPTTAVQQVDKTPPDPFSGLAAVRADIGDCTRCKLHRQGRKQIVFGVGNPDADLMFVGEAPGADEDIQGIPFVGRAGQLLTKIIEAIGLERDDVYIANVIKCRPPQNRNPEQDEVRSTSSNPRSSSPWGRSRRARCSERSIRSHASGAACMSTVAPSSFPRSTRRICSGTLRRSARFGRI
jgi:hypothetical protein